MPRLVAWLARPHVAEWFTAPAAFTDEVEGNLDADWIRFFIVHHQGQPIGFIQDYDAVNQPVPVFAGEPAGTRGIDQFIGEADFVDRGHGSAFIRLFVERLLAAGAPRIITDPDPANARAVRAYQKAGFRARSLVDTPFGQTLLMECNA